MRLAYRSGLFLSISIFALTAAGVSLAQTDTALPIAESPVIEKTADVPATESPTTPEMVAPDFESLEAEEDDNITDTELGVEEARVLPDSPLYSLKRFGRQLRRAFIFDDAKNVEREVKDANQELADLKRLMDQKGNQASEAVLRGFDRVSESFDRIAEKTVNINIKDDTARRAVLERLLNSEVKRQKMFEQIERKSTDERVLERAQTVREHTLDRVGAVVASISPDAGLFDRVLQNQEGSEFKDLRNLEVLRRLEEKLPEAARTGIKQAEENAFQRLRQSIGDFRDNESESRFREYLKDSGGDRVIRYEILDKLDQNLQVGGVQNNILEHVKQARDLSAQEFQIRFDEMSERVKDEDRLERLKEQMLNRLNGEKSEGQTNFETSLVKDTSERIELMSKFKANIRSGELAQKIEEVENKEINRFIEAFPDAREDAEQAKQAMVGLRQAAAQGDFKEVKLLEKVLENLKERQLADPSKRAFMEQMEETRREVERGFVEHLRQNTENAAEFVSSDDPQKVEFMRKMKPEFLNGDIGGGAPNPASGLNPDGFDPGPVGSESPVGFDPGPVGNGRATKQGSANPNGAPNKLEQRGLIPIPSGKPTDGLEQRGLIPIPSGKPQSDLERRGLIPIPSGKPTDGVEQRGLIPIPSGDTGPGAFQPRPTPSPVSDTKDGGNDTEKVGLIPIPSGKPQSDLERRGLIPIPSGKPTDAVEQRGLIPIPSGDTGPGGNSGPSPAPRR